MIASKQNGVLLILVVLALFRHPTSIEPYKEVIDLYRDEASSYHIVNGATGNGSSSSIDTHYATQSLPLASSLGYTPSYVESYVMEHSQKFGYDEKSRNNRPKGCSIWTDPNETSIFNNLQEFRSELKEYGRQLDLFNGTVKDLRLHMTDDDKSICDTLELHKDGLAGIFRNSRALSSVSGAGLVEPLITPLRHPEFCFQKKKKLMNLGYLVHDFASLCRNRLKKHSRTVFIDMGAALDFHADTLAPAVYITHMYQKFGFHFDHIYAYEIAKKDPEAVYQQIPDDLKAAYHWYNVGVDANVESSNNPLKMLLEGFTEDDFVVVKLDIDTSFVEVPMAQLLIQDERFHRLVDCFYFEHHVSLGELAPYWGSSMRGSVEDSLKFFTSLREKGIASHYWP